MPTHDESPYNPNAPLPVLLTIIYIKNYGRLVGRANKYVNEWATAEDIVHDCFARLLDPEKEEEIVKSLTAKNKAGEVGISEERLISYVYITVNNRCIDYLRKIKLKLDPGLIEKQAELPDPSPEEIEIEKIREQAVKELHKKIYTQLDERDKKIAEGRYVDELKIREVANKTGIDETTIGNRLKEIKKVLKGEK